MPSWFPRAVAEHANVLGAESVTQTLEQPLYYWNNFDVLINARNHTQEETKDFDIFLKMSSDLAITDEVIHNDLY